MSAFQELTIPKPLTEYCEVREQALELWQRGVRLIEEANKLAATVNRYGLGGHYEPRDGLKAVTKNLDRSLWQTAFDKTGLMQLMDAEARRQFERDLNEHPPAFTLENLRSTFLDASQNADEMFKRGLVNVFRGLSKNHKTNTNEPFKVNDRAILGYMVGHSYAPGCPLQIGRGFDMGRAESVINDIDRAFKVLDGKQHHPRALEIAVNGAFAKGEVYEDEYYRIKGFKNGNLHIQFKRHDLLDKANLIIHEYYEGSALAKGRAA